MTPNAPASLGERPFFYHGGFSWMMTSEKLVTVLLQVGAHGEIYAELIVRYMPSS